MRLTESVTRLAGNETVDAVLAPTGTLYLVGTPIGNLEDISFRAIRILKTVNVVAAEDTRMTRKLLSHFDIHTPLVSFHQHSNQNKSAELIRRLLAGDCVALVTDAGMPGISDPGYALTAEAVDNGIVVIPIPGPCAAVTALAASGLPTGRFVFEGFPPRSRSDRSEFFKNLKHENRTMILYESPARLISTLRTLLEELGNRPISACRELTKLHEEIWRGAISDCVDHFEKKGVRGEFTLIIQGKESEPPENMEGQDIASILTKLISSGLSERDAVRMAAETLSMPRREVYSQLIAMKSAREVDF